MIWVCGRSHCVYQQQQQQGGIHVKSREMENQQQPLGFSHTDPRSRNLHTLTTFQDEDIYLGFLPLVFLSASPNPQNSSHPNVKGTKSGVRKKSSLRADSTSGAFLCFCCFCFLTVLPQQRPSCPQPRLRVFTLPDTRTSQRDFVRRARVAQIQQMRHRRTSRSAVTFASSFFFFLQTHNDKQQSL